MRRTYGELVKRFEGVFGPAQGLVVARAPGRVNLIGEHTDYNDGFVLPMAIDRSVYAVGRRRAGGRVRLHSLDYRESVEFEKSDLRRDAAHPWSDYVKGMMQSFGQDGAVLGGFDAVILGDVPQGAGLSSSAALEVSVGLLLGRLFGHEATGTGLAKLAQAAESGFVGVNCGIMDQFVSALGQKGHALLIDCRSLEYRAVPLAGDDVVVAVADTGVRRGLVDSEYNNRRRECATGVELLRKFAPAVRALRDVSPGLLAAHEGELPPVVRNRCAHVVGENERVQQAVRALHSGDAAAFGRLMNESHSSLRELYEVSCPALDAMVEAAQGIAGVFGTRMTGAGFGGCTVSLVGREAADEFAGLVLERYERLARGIAHDRPEVFRFCAEQGAEIMEG